MALATASAAITVAAAPVGLATNVTGLFYNLLEAIDVYHYNTADAIQLRDIAQSVAQRWHNVGDAALSQHERQANNLIRVCHEALRWHSKYCRYSQIRRFCRASAYSAKFVRAQSSILVYDTLLERDYMAAMTMNQYQEYISSGSDGSASPQI